MSDYTKTTDFLAKDSLAAGNANKVIKGTEFEVEFDAIAAAIATKANTADVQPLNANLTEYATVNPTAAGLALLDDADAAAQRTTLGLTDSATATAASQAEMETGTEAAIRSVSPLRVAQAITELGLGGNAQTMQDFSGSRVKGTPYTNDTGRPIVLYVHGTTDTAGGSMKVTLTASGIAIQGSHAANIGGGVDLNGIVVPIGDTYTVAGVGGTLTVSQWYELR